MDSTWLLARKLTVLLYYARLRLLIVFKVPPYKVRERGFFNNTFFRILYLQGSNRICGCLLVEAVGLEMADFKVVFVTY